MESDATNFRRDRIEKLLYELQYEISRGIIEREIDETLVFQFYVPNSVNIPRGVVFCEFRSRPTTGYGLSALGPRLHLVASSIKK